MRPQDVAILLKIVLLGKNEWQYQDLARSLCISGAEVNASLNRSKLAGLIDHNRKRVNKQALYEFLQHGIQYVFPIQPGALTKGIPTAHSHPDIKEQIVSEGIFVWPDINGTEIGQTIEPLFNTQVRAIREDPGLYEVLSLIEILRVGKTREKNIALQQLKKVLDQ
ncbi:MAG TPA: hypothetical protein DCZ87_02355 [Chitinophagaceae bacterium]|nr:hypothetical protein [Chitinophagaceae bacterium]